MVLRCPKRRNHRRNFWRIENRGLEVWEVPLDGVQMFLRCADKKQKRWVCRPALYNANPKSLGLEGREDEEQRPGLTPFVRREGAWGSFKWLLFSNVRINFPGRRMFWIFQLVGGGDLRYPVWSSSEVPWWSEGCKWETFLGGLGSLRSCLGTETNVGAAGWDYGWGVGRAPGG